MSVVLASSPTGDVASHLVPAGLGSPCRAPARTVRVGVVPRPRIRPLTEVLAALGAADPAVRAPDPSTAPTTDPDATALDTTAMDPLALETLALDTLATAARPAALSLFGVLAEILDGRRPTAHLRPLCDEDLYARAVTQLGADHRSARRGGRAGRSRVRGVRVCAVGPTAAEVSAVVHRDDRARALAARLERSGRRWRLTALVVG